MTIVTTNNKSQYKKKKKKSIKSNMTGVNSGARTSLVEAYLVDIVLYRRI